MRAAFEAAIREGHVVLFPADTVYGLAVDATNPDAVDALYALKGRPPAKPAAIMVFQEDRLRPMPAAARALLPGQVTLLVPNPDHLFPLACGPTPDVLGVRLPKDSPLAGADVVVLQSSANRSGGPDARTLDGVDPAVRAGVALELDAGPLPGTPSTVVDLTEYAETGEYRIVREGAVAAAVIAGSLRP